MENDLPLPSCWQAAQEQPSLSSLSFSPPRMKSVRANNDTINRRCDGSCSMIEVRSASAAVDAPRWLLGWPVSLHLLWQLSSSLIVGREAAVKLGNSACRLFSEEGCSPGLRLFSPTVDLSLCLGGTGLACCYCGCAGGEGADLEGLA